MRIHSAVFVAAVITLACTFSFAETPITLSVCELYQHAPKYNKKLVEVRGIVGFGFENFTLNAADCKLDEPSVFDPSVYKSSPDVWLEFGGDLEAPVTYCCGSHRRKKGVDLKVDGVTVPLQKDSEFARFLELLTAKRERNQNGEECYQGCYFNKVTATITGRFFSGEQYTRLDGKYFYQGYGHLGCCSLLVIQSVTHIAYEKTGVPNTPDH
jgi:hypothetical protein